MNISSIWSRKDPLKKALVSLEDSMEDALKEEFLVPEPEIEAEAFETRELLVIEDEQMEAEAEDADLPALLQEEPQEDRMTPHARRRLMDHSAFEASQARISEEVGRIGDALAAIVASAHVSREYAADSFADIHRANDLETGNIAYAIENRRLLERVGKLEKLRARYDQLVDVLKRREMKLTAEVEQLREALNESKLELVEAHNVIVRGESVHSELRADLAARGGEAERHMRANESLREKNSGLTLELEMAHRKMAELRRKSDELSMLHTGDAARLADMMSRVTSEEAENMRLQKLADSLDARLSEVSENASRLAADLAETEKRHTSEAHALRQEVQSLKLKLQSAAATSGEQAAELDAARTRIGDLETERQVLEKRSNDLRAEMDGERRSRAANDDMSDDHPEMRGRQVEQMRAEMEELRATVARLKRYEGLYAAAKSRAKTKADAVSTFSSSKGKIEAEQVLS
jgi:chromosome segregation ATPase